MRACRLRRGGERTRRATICGCATRSGHHRHHRAGLRADERAAGARFRVAATALTMASISATTRAWRCCCSSTISSALLRRARRSPLCSGACPRRSVISRALGTEMGELRERITSTARVRSPRSGGLFRRHTDPAPATTFAHLDVSVALARAVRAKIFPGGGSAGLNLAAARAARGGDRSTTERARSRKILRRYRDLRDIIAILGIEGLSPEPDDRGTGAALQQFLTQPMFVAEALTACRACVPWRKLSTAWERIWPVIMTSCPRTPSACRDHRGRGRQSQDSG